MAILPIGKKDIGRFIHGFIMRRGRGGVEAGVWRFGGISTSEILDQRPPGGSIGDIGRKWALPSALRSEGGAP